MTFRDDERGVMQAFEAVMVAILITSAILYVTATSNPVLETTGTGVDVDDIAATMLEDLDRFSPDLAGRIELALAGDASELEDDMIPVLQKFPGFRYALRLDNGVGTMQLAPSAGGILNTPRGAGGASILVFPELTVGSAITTYQLGAAANFGGWTDLASPAGSIAGPGGASWHAIWTDMEPGQDRIPAGIPLGTWTCTVTCTSFEVTVADGIVVERPAYGLQLLIWDGAG